MVNNNIRKSECLRSMMLFLLGAVVAACSKDSEGNIVTAPTYDADEALPVGFSTDMSTRGASLINSIDDLKNISGFGVFAYFTDTYTWDQATNRKDSEDNIVKLVPDFMNNQQVSWRVRSFDAMNNEPVYDWWYSPVKYWPNSSKDAGPRYISFFAYAPYEPDVGEYGITCMLNEDEDKALPQLEYKLDLSGKNMASDLLYADAVLDAQRDGNGLIGTENGGNVYQKVPLTFHHALACVDIYIQRIYEEPHYSGKVPDDENVTKLFVSELKLEPDKGSCFYDSGTFDLESGNWTYSPSSDASVTYADELFDELISGTKDDDPAIVADRELNKWGNVDGVDEKERCLFKGNASVFFLPQGEVQFTPTLTYSMVTRDESLSLSDYKDMSGRAYARIKNSVTGNSLKINFEQGKRYHLLIHVGVETVEFEVVSVTDWDLPMRYDPDVVKDFQDESINKKLEENKDEE